MAQIRFDEFYKNYVDVRTWQQDILINTDYTTWKLQ